MRRLLCAAVVALVTLGLASPAWGQGGPVVHTEQVTIDTSSLPSENPCTGDPGIVTFNDRYVAKITTFPDGSAHYNVHGTGTFDFDATDPAAADFFAVPEHPTNLQFRADVNGNGTVTRVDGYDARGTDGSRVLAHGVIRLTVVGFTMLTPTREHFQLHCFG
jgi:hypothetical protein